MALAAARLSLDGVSAEASRAMARSGRSTVLISSAFTRLTSGEDIEPARLLSSSFMRAIVPLRRPLNAAARPTCAQNMSLLAAREGTSVSATSIIAVPSGE